MATAADILFWTKFTVTGDAAVRFSTAAETRLNLDGGSEISGELRTQLVCYLIGDMIAAGDRDGAGTTERIGDYSYTKSADETDYWLKKYRDALAVYAGALAVPSSANGGFAQRTVDNHVVRMSRTFTEPEFY